MSALTLMVRGSDSMFVPPAKLQEYLQDSWVVVSEPEAVPAVKQAPAESEAVSVDEAAAKLGSKSKSKG